MNGVVESDHPTRGSRAGPTLLPLVSFGAVAIALLSAAGTSAIDVGKGWLPGTLFQSGEVLPAGGAPSDEPAASPLGWLAAGGLALVLLALVAGLLFSVWMVTIAGLGYKVRRPLRAGGTDATRVESERDPRPAGVAMRRTARRAPDERRGPAGDGDPSDAVVAAWLSLERAAAAAGSGHAPRR